MVAKQTYKLSNITQGVFCGYAPVTFGDNYCSVLHTMIHSVVMDSRFRSCPLEDQTADANETEDEPVIKIIVLEEPNKLEERETFRAQNVAQYLFGDDEGNMPKKVGADDADEVYDDYVSVLNRVEVKLASKLIDLAQRTLTEADAKQLISTV